MLTRRFSKPGRRAVDVGVDVVTGIELGVEGLGAQVSSVTVHLII